MANIDTPRPHPALVTPAVDQWGNTSMKVLKFSYTWTIRNFTFWPQNTGEMLQSPTFEVGENVQYTWCLHLYPKGRNKQSENSLSVFLSLVSSTDDQVTATFQFSILNLKRKKSNLWKMMHPCTFAYHSEEHGFPWFLPRNFLLDDDNELLPNNNLTIVCDISIVDNVVNVSGKSDEMSVNFWIPECRIIEDFSVLFETEKFSDVTLEACEREFRAHKAILAGRSPVFSAMFDHEMTEQKENRIVISDMEDDVLHEMLRFIYTGKTTKMQEMADKLLAAAEKYALERLKIMCAETLCSSLTVENASNVLILADLYNTDRLKAQTIEFINIHMLEVLETTDFKKMIELNPRLITEILRGSAIRTNILTDL